MATIMPEEQIPDNDSDVWTENPGLLYARGGLNVLRVGNSGPPLTIVGGTIGLRFSAVPIPQGANIISASFTVKATDNLTVDDCKTEIQGEATDDAPIWPPSKGGPSGFDAARFAFRTTAKVLWDPVEHFATDVEYTSPDIKVIIQEIVDRPGWASGNGMAIFWHDWDGNSDTGAYREVWSHEIAGGADAPKLNITYISPGGGSGYGLSGLIPVQII